MTTDGYKKKYRKSRKQVSSTKLNITTEMLNIHQSM